MKETSSNSVIILEISGHDTIHCRRAASFSRIPISPPLPLIFWLFCSWNSSSDMSEKVDAVPLLVNIPPRSSGYNARNIFGISSRSRTNTSNQHVHSTACDSRRVHLL
ncbi:hypothetical protein AVEN_259501-1 [Araneus ventricosus]|uniref:Uncharacterized protein n=1 Tax=Araneus ventricosus TaxID=182803 RepID=A0A4Y2A4N7_ARAVE|nr:hypothetical protein AVEN_259501-1 [Araneus ventricosus]